MELRIAQHGTPRICAYCHDALGSDRATCDACATAYHRPCFAELPSCGTIGCSSTHLDPLAPPTVDELRGRLDRIEDLIAEDPIGYAARRELLRTRARRGWFGVFFGLALLWAGIGTAPGWGLVAAAVAVLASAGFFLLINDLVRSAHEQSLPHLHNPEAQALAVELREQLDTQITYPIPLRLTLLLGAAPGLAVYLGLHGLVGPAIALVGAVYTCALPSFAQDATLVSICARLTYLRRLTSKPGV